MRKRLAGLRIEHRDLDAAIDALTAAGASDQLQIAQLGVDKAQSALGFAEKNYDRLKPQIDKRFAAWRKKRAKA